MIRLHVLPSSVGDLFNSQQAAFAPDEALGLLKGHGFSTENDGFVLQVPDILVVLGAAEGTGSTFRYCELQYIYAEYVFLLKMQKAWRISPEK